MAVAGARLTIRDTALSISNERDSAGPHGGIPVNEDTSLNCLRVNNSSEHGRVLIRADLDVVTGARVAERLACDAVIQLAGLDGSGVPLALGRRQRLFSEHQRKALLLRDKGCIECGDQRPWVHAHH
ncbi:hypothetical protein [Gordonia jinhuaensis]|uniref:hypothetical protein n=1 Tax=Gordonia jinhuaensis TaxID=1517702 RepID=UPI0016651DDF|nr:hypothetical protein [Gordonia jinhuaensis]